MTKFYICTTGIAKGPYWLSDVDKLEIKSGDIIWSTEYFEGRKAMQIPELKAYFKKKQINTIDSCNRTPSSQRILLAVLLCALAGMVFYYYAVIY